MKKTIRKILVANRGEIALRIMRTCRDMGISTVAIFSEADKDALFIKAADEAIAIGGFSPSESYLDQDKIIAAVKRTGADAIHPGYGFLSENASFARRCRQEGITFIGPSPEAIEAMGDKKRAKELVAKYDVPTVPGYDGADQSIKALVYHAGEVGFPLLLKASAGGGGKGMRIVREAKHLEREIEGAKREALGAFGDDTLLIERYFEGAKHIEFQIFGDQHGNAIHLFERECSVQRRYQKIIEESPSPALDEGLRARMAQAAINVARSVKYDNAGTVEFILDNEGNFYFLEVNARLQVEHPVTEAITGLDLVRLQIDVANGKKLPLKQNEIERDGHAIECRLYAEDPYNNYLPITGKVVRFIPFEHDALRYDAGIETGSVVDVFYDPMMAKVIAYAETRDEAIDLLNYALQKTVLLGLTTNKTFLREVLNHDDFRSGKFNTQFLAQNPELSIASDLPDETLHELAVVTTVFRWHQRKQQQPMLKEVPSGWRNNFYQYQLEVYKYHDSEIIVRYRNNNNTLHLLIGEAEYTSKVIYTEDEFMVAETNGLRRQFIVAQNDNKWYIFNDQLGDIELLEIPRFPEVENEKIQGGYIAPMPGQVVKVLVQPGDTIKAGDALVILNSMKMETTIEAFEDGTVEEVYVVENGFVAADEILVKIVKA